MPYKDPEKRREKDRRYYADNAESICRQRKTKYESQREEALKRKAELAPKHRAKNAKRAREQYRTLRLEILAAYGGSCVCCGEREPLFLELDHVNGDGAAHRREIGRGARAAYNWARKNNWPDSLQLLCANCNQGKKRNGGTCPHKRHANGQS